MNIFDKNLPTKLHSKIRSATNRTNRKTTSSAVLYLIVFGFALCICTYALRDRIIYERVDLLLSSKGTLITGVVPEPPERPRTRRRAPDTGTFVVTYAVEDTVTNHTQPYQRVFTIERSMYDFLAQSNGGTFPVHVTIQYLPQQPIISRPVVRGHAGDLVDIRYTTFNNTFLGILIFASLLLGFFSASLISEFAHYDRQISGLIRYRNQDAIFYWMCYAIALSFALSLYIGMIPLGEQDFIAYCQQEHNNNRSWFPC